jgi:hypothetical protein
MVARGLPAMHDPEKLKAVAMAKTHASPADISIVQGNFA